MEDAALEYNLTKLEYIITAIYIFRSASTKFPDNIDQISEPSQNIERFPKHFSPVPQI